MTSLAKPPRLRCQRQPPADHASGRLRKRLACLLAACAYQRQSMLLRPCSIHMLSDIDMITHNKRRKDKNPISSKGGGCVLWCYYWVLLGQGVIGPTLLLVQKRRCLLLCTWECKRAYQTFTTFSGECVPSYSAAMHVSARSMDHHGVGPGHTGGACFVFK